MDVLIIGYGKMGREVEQLIKLMGDNIAGIVDNYEQLCSFNGSAEVAIEFTTPSACVQNILWCLDHRIPVVVGTTGWYDKLNEVEQKCKESDGALIWGSNFSVGMNILFQVNKMLASLMSNFDEYKCSIDEVHHIQKLDKPSGTAITLAQMIIQAHPRYTTWKLDSDAGDGVLPVYAFRQEDVRGIHTVKWSGSSDVISITHQAVDRRGFAQGALLAARWIIGKKGMFAFSEYFTEIIFQKQ